MFDYIKSYRYVSVRMSSESDSIASIILAQTYLYRFGGPILMGVGSISCILNLIIFTKKKLRKNPCSVYFISLNIINFLYIYMPMLQSILLYGFNINFTASSSGFCRFHLYLTFLFDIVSPFYLILASVDRVLITSRNARTRQLSTRRLCLYMY